MSRKKRELSPSEIAMCEIVANDTDLLAKVLGTVRAAKGADGRFDINLAEGRVSEDLLKKILTGEDTIEVKQDFKVGETGNVVVELAHRKKDKIEPTGLSTTEARWWGFVFAGEEYNNEVMLLIDTERLKRLVRAYGVGHSLSGKGGRSHFELLPIERLLTPEELIKRWEKAWLTDGSLDE
jgi:hypothetical protein